MTTTPPDTDIADARRLVACDWLTTLTANRLHHAGLTDQQAAVMWEDRHLTTPVKLSCGRTVDYVSIPGVLTRMGTQRCRGCCRNLGYPPGKGSPKNDPECRRLLGLDAA